MAEIVPTNPGGEFLLYQTQDGRIRIQCRLQGETLWLTQQQMAELFQVDKSGISRHLKNIYETGELSQESVVAKFATTATDGKTYQVEGIKGVRYIFSVYLCVLRGIRLVDRSSALIRVHPWFQFGVYLC